MYQPTKELFIHGSRISDVFSLIPGPHQKPQQLQSPKTPALCILRKYRVGISVGWSYWSGWKKGVACNEQLQPYEIPTLYFRRIRRASVFGWAARCGPHMNPITYHLACFRSTIHWTSRQEIKGKYGCQFLNKNLRTKVVAMNNIM